MPIFAQTNSYIMKNKVIRKELGQWMNSCRETIYGPLAERLKENSLKQPKAPDDVSYVIELTIK